MKASGYSRVLQFQVVCLKSPVCFLLHCIQPFLFVCSLKVSSLRSLVFSSKAFRALATLFVGIPLFKNKEIKFYNILQERHPDRTTQAKMDPADVVSSERLEKMVEEMVLS